MSALLFALACSTHRTHIEVAGEPIRSTDLAIAAPLFLGDMDADDSDPFLRNTYVGNLIFSGGFVTENTADGMFNVSKQIEPSNQQKYRGQVRDWLADTLGKPNTDLNAPPPPPRRRERRGSTSRDGRDNISLPRIDFVPVDGGNFERPVLVPWVVSYLSHNAGWFFGQEYGTGAGARIRILLVAYDTDGTVIGWTDVDGSRTSERVFSPTGPQLQDLLIDLEKRVGRKLD